MPCAPSPQADRKPIFDAFRAILGRGFTQGEVDMIDRAIDLALKKEPSAPASQLGRLSQRFESGGRGPGTVSGASGDPGGASYGTYQLSSASGSAAAFLESEGLPWRSDFGDARPGTAAFSAIWRAVAQREPDRFAQAEHAFIERTHYRPAIAAVLEQTGFDLASRHPAVREVVWSVAVQHGGAAKILTAAIAGADRGLSRNDPAYDQRLVEAIYAERTRYVLNVARRSGVPARRVLLSITRNRYPAELKAALAMFGETGAGS